MRVEGARGRRGGAQGPAESGVLRGSARRALPLLGRGPGEKRLLAPGAGGRFPMLSTVKREPGSSRRRQCCHWIPRCAGSLSSRPVVCAGGRSWGGRRKRDGVPALICSQPGPRGQLASSGPQAFPGLQRACSGTRVFTGTGARAEPDVLAEHADSRPHSGGAVRPWTLHSKQAPRPH